MIRHIPSVPAALLGTAHSLPHALSLSPSSLLFSSWGAQWGIEFPNVVLYLYVHSILKQEIPFYCLTSKLSLPLIYHLMWNFLLYEGMPPTWTLTPFFLVSRPDPPSLPSKIKEFDCAVLQQCNFITVFVLCYEILSQRRSNPCALIHLSGLNVAPSPILLYSGKVNVIVLEYSLK